MKNQKLLESIYYELIDMAHESMDKAESKQGNVYSFCAIVKTIKGIDIVQWHDGITEYENGDGDELYFVNRRKSLLEIQNCLDAIIEDHKQYFDNKIIRNKTKLLYAKDRFLNQVREELEDNGYSAPFEYFDYEKRY